MPLSLERILQLADEAGRAPLSGPNRDRLQRLAHGASAIAA